MRKASLVLAALFAAALPACAQEGADSLPWSFAAGAVFGRFVVGGAARVGLSWGPVTADFLLLAYGPSGVDPVEGLQTASHFFVDAWLSLGLGIAWPWGLALSGSLLVGAELGVLEERVLDPSLGIDETWRTVELYPDFSVMLTVRWLFLDPWGMEFCLVLSLKDIRRSMAIVGIAWSGR